MAVTTATSNQVIDCCSGCVMAVMGVLGNGGSGE
jgi:hypothetical protein